MIYARLNPTDYASLFRRALDAEVSSVRTTSLESLTLDDDAVLHDILGSAFTDAETRQAATAGTAVGAA